MKRVISLFVLLIPFRLEACRLGQESVSLSGAATGVLAELGLLSDPSLKGISLFNPIPQKDFSGPRYGGGVFLAQKTVQTFHKKIVFYDESAELTLRLKEAQLNHLVEIKTRSLDPFEVTSQTLAKLKPHLKDCQPQVQRLEDWLATERSFLLSQKKLAPPVFFFLGKIKNQRLPELMMVNDGPVKFWRTYNLISTFDSVLPYVRWGNKWRRHVSPQAQFIGLEEGPVGAEFQFFKEHGPYMNVQGSGVLTPGVSQIRFMRRFMEQWQGL